VQELPDSLIWKQISQGDAQAFHSLYHTYFDDLYLFGQKLCANNDLVQDTLQKLFLYIWDTRSTMVAPKHTKAYLFRSFRNNLVREIKREQQISGLAIDQLPVDIPDAVPSEEHTEEHARLQAALSQLPAREREVLHLRFYQGIGNKEVSDIMGISYQSVSNLLQRAIKHLKTLIQQQPWSVIAPLVWLTELFY